MKYHQDQQHLDLDLIPGLPADVARECLARVPFSHFPRLRLTSPLWNQQLASHSFHFLRKSISQTRQLIALLHTTTTFYRLTLFDPSSATSYPVPPLPARDHPNGLPLFSRLVAVDRALLLIGGWDPLTWAPTDGVFIFDLISASWRRGAPMPGGTKRSFFGCAASTSGRPVVLVAGGHDDRKDALTSAMAYDVVKDEWALLPDMDSERDECSVAFLNGGFHVIGGYSTDAQGRFEKSAEVFDFDKQEWGPVNERFLETATCPRTCVAGEDRLYICEDDGHVAVREKGTRGWRKVVEMPAEMRAPLQAVELWGGKLMVMGSGMQSGAQVCYLLEEEQTINNKMTWTKVDLPEDCSGHIQAACSLEI